MQIRYSLYAAFTWARTHVPGVLQIHIQYIRTCMSQFQLDL